MPGEIVHFNAFDSFAFDEYGVIEEEDVEYMWRFGDGHYSFMKQCTHIYDTPGQYNIILRIRVFDYYIEEVGGFLMDFAYFTVYVTQPGVPLSANADSNNLGGYEGLIHYPVQFYGSVTGGEPPYTFDWDFGDGYTSNINNPTHIYDIVGEYTAKLTINDNTGETASDTVTVTITENELIADAGGPYSGSIKDQILFKGNAIGGVEPYIFLWDFDDGTISKDVNPSHIFEKQGIYNIKLSVIDSIGNFDEDIVIVEIIEDNDKPVEIKQVSGGFGIKAIIAAGNTDCNWNIVVDGRLLFFGGEASGTIKANNEETVKLPLTFALGKVQITVTANEIQKDYTAFALGPLFISLKEI